MVSVNLTESRFNWEMGLWGNDWEFSGDCFEVGRHSHYGQHHSLGFINGEREVRHYMFIVLCFLIRNAKLRGADIAAVGSLGVLRVYPQGWYF